MYVYFVARLMSMLDLLESRQIARQTLFYVGIHICMKVYELECYRSNNQ